MSIIQQKGGLSTELEDLIKSIDIVAFLSQYMELEQRGEEFWGLSCLKEENTPSFSVRKDPPFFYDYSSGVGGNVYSFVKHYHRCSSREAVRILKEYVGFDGEVSAPKRMQAAMDCRRYAPKKSTQKQAKATVLPDNYMERYEKRPDKLHIWEREGVSKASLERFQVRYDGFSDRLVYPIRDPDGRIVNVGGRTLDEAWKEKKLRKYTYTQSWGTINTLYGLYENLEAIQRAHEVIIFEGCKSVLLADTWGIPNTAALLTSHLSGNQLKLLARLGCRVVFALDKDVCIRDDKNIRKLNRYVNVEYLWDGEHLTEEKDSPVDKGREVFLRLYESRLRLG